MKRIVVFLMGLSLVACSQSQTKDQFSTSNQQTAFSASESAPAIPGATSAAQAGAGGGSPTASDASQKSSTQAAATAAATSPKRSSSDNTNRSLTWLFGTVGVLVGFVLATDAVTGGQAVGLFGEKRYPEQQRKPEVPSETLTPAAGAPAQTVVPAPATQAKTEECALPPSSSAAPSATIQSAQDVVQFAESPKTP
jgi:hypothetical protein